MPLNENELLDAFCESKNESECLLLAYDIIEDTLDMLLNQIFHKEDYSVKYVVDPLLRHDGPLGDVLVRAKLLLGLGMISKQTYQEIDVIVTLREWVKLQEEKVSFADPNVLFELSKIITLEQDIAALTSAFNGAEPLYLPEVKAEHLSSEVLLYQRHYQRVRSAIFLAINQMVTSLTSCQCYAK